MKQEFYSNSHEHLYDELLLVDLLIHAQVLKFREDNKSAEHNLQGLYISEQEVDALLKDNDSSGWVNRAPAAGTEYEKLSEAVLILSNAIRTRVARSLEQGVSLKLIKMAELYQLGVFEVNLFCICLAAQFSSKYSKLFAYLQNDVTRKNPSVELSLNLLCRSFKEKVEARHFFSPQATLFKNNILEYVENPQQAFKTGIMQEITVNSRILGYILDSGFLDDDISLIGELYRSQTRLEEMVLLPELQEKLQNFTAYFNRSLSPGYFIFSFFGAYGAQKQEAAAAVCNQLGIPLLVVDLLALSNADLYFEQGVDLILRECRLIPAAVYFKNCDFLFSSPEADPYLKRYFLKELDSNSLLAFLSSDEMLPIHGEFKKQRFISLEFCIPGYLQRKQLWATYLENSNLDSGIDLAEIAGKYNLTAGQIRDIVSTAGTYALWRSPEQALITQQDLSEACHLHSNQKLSRLARRITPRHKWEDIVLAAEIKVKLQDLVEMFKHKHTVYDEWDFNRKLSLGKGISALFYGEPGTGKTLACEIIAAELGMDLYKIDISTVVSKYIGETEKNLRKIFTEAECSNAILFFDEADALFGKRTEVKDAHDRYANIEVSYLLQQIDEYNGVVILATNYSQNIDQAFERRLHFSINFPFPAEDARLAIWQNIFPAATPLAGDLDYSFLARKFDVSGGHIKNIALTAAFYSARRKQEVSMEIVLQACRSEYEKISRLWNAADFKLK